MPRPRRPAKRRRNPFQARFADRGYAIAGSVSTFTSAGLPLANARSSAGRSSSGERTSSPCPPSAAATSCAAIDLALEPYDAARVEGHVLSVDRLREIRDRLAALPLEERTRVPGLHPDRAAVIVAGVVILLRVLDAYGLDRVEVSERDILWGVALASTTSP